LRLPQARRAKVLPFIVQWCSHRAAAFTGDDVIQAYAQVLAMAEAAVAATQPYDFVISPTSPILAYDALLPAPTDDPRNALPHIAFTVPYNMSGQPAASLTWTWSDVGLPIGIQIVGRRFDYAGVLRLARLGERLRPAQRPWPQVPLP
jgi:aspartyl-tRNA(Asn)/glutamyl-tRNA(Gln) amidotransferase subunit A